MKKCTAAAIGHLTTSTTTSTLRKTETESRVAYNKQIAYVDDVSLLPPEWKSNGVRTYVVHTIELILQWVLRSHFRIRKYLKWPRRHVDKEVSKNIGNHCFDMIMGSCYKHQENHESNGKLITMVILRIRSRLDDISV